MGRVPRGGFFRRSRCAWPEAATFRHVSMALPGGWKPPSYGLCGRRACRSQRCTVHKPANLSAFHSELFFDFLPRHDLTPTIFRYRKCGARGGSSAQCMAPEMQCRVYSLDGGGDRLFAFHLPRSFSQWKSHNNTHLQISQRGIPPPDQTPNRACPFFLPCRCCSGHLLARE